MAALDIQPHSRSVSGVAVAGLMLLAVGSFASGLAHQVAARAGGAAFTPVGRLQIETAIPEATPAPEMQIAVATSAPHRKGPTEPAPVVATDESAAPPATDSSAPAAAAPPAPAEDPPSA